MSFFQVEVEAVQVVQVQQELQIPLETSYGLPHSVNEVVVVGGETKLPQV
jgi:hypothetical protein